MSEESNALDEAMTGTGRSVRMALMMGGQAAEVISRRVAEQQRRLAEDARDRQRLIEASFYDARDAARQAYEPVADPARFQSRDSETVAAAWATAKAWADVDPRAAQAEAALSEQIQERWGVDPADLSPSSQEERGAEGMGPQQYEQDTDTEVEANDEAEHESPLSDPAATQSDRFAQAVDPEWRAAASDADLESRWHEANDAGSRPGAPEARSALDAALAERHGVDLDKFHEQLHNGLGDHLWNAEADRSALDADAAAEGVAERTAAGWESEAHERFAREAAAEDVGEEIEESVDARDAQGMANAWRDEAEAQHSEAQVAHGETPIESRADPAAMEANGVPARSQEVRTRTAKGFGTTTEQGAQAKRHARARKNVNQASRSTERDMGR